MGNFLNETSAFSNILMCVYSDPVIFAFYFFFLLQTARIIFGLAYILSEEGAQLGNRYLVLYGKKAVNRSLFAIANSLFNL